MPETHFPKVRKNVSPERCLPCHEEAVEQWRKSQHAVANRLIGKDVDLPNFHPDVPSVDGSYVPTIEGASLRIEGPGAHLSPYSDAVGVIGVDPLIQYLMPAEGGRWQAHELAYDHSENEWFNIFVDEGRLPGEWGHWSGQGMNWNSNCAWCHMTSYEKNYDIDLDTYSSTWVAHGVSCLQCHTNSEAHTLAAEKGDYVSADSNVNTPALAMENCASCHSRREQLTEDEFRAGERFHDHYRLSLPDVPYMFFPDGQNLDENYVYSSLMLSRMGHAGVTCLDCHDSHSYELILPATNNALCQRCHEAGALNAPVIEPLVHSRHAAGSKGNQCIECHMPHRTYMARDPRRDHGFTSPDPALNLEIGSPDACIKCHADQPEEWVIEYADNWFDSPKREERRDRARMLHQAYDTLSPLPTEALLEALEKTDQVYWKATYLRMLSTSPEASSLGNWIQPYLSAEETVLRAAAVRALGASGASNEVLRGYLQDSARVVRMEAVDALSSRNVFFEEGADEVADYFRANADRPGPALQMASMVRGEDGAGLARLYIKRAASFDPTNPEIYFHGAILLDQDGDIDGAFDVLRSAPAEARRTGLIYYGEGLLWAEKGDFEQSARRLQLALEKDYGQDRWWYNLAIAFTRIGDRSRALGAIDNAIKIAPANPAYLRLRASLQ